MQLSWARITQKLRVAGEDNGHDLDYLTIREFKDKVTVLLGMFCVCKEVLARLL